VEDLVLKGDISKLTPEQKVEYYNGLCESLGLNPLPRPFEYIRLQGREVLYAKKEATEQLRKKHGVSVTNMNQNIMNGVCVTTVTGQDAHGRTDVATGAVDVSGLKGDALANALMKSETKAKRRLTLSMCGLGILDETEIETMPEAKTIKEIQVERELGDIEKAKRETDNYIEYSEVWLPEEAIEVAKLDAEKAYTDGDIKAMRDVYKSVKKQVDAIEREEGKERTKKGFAEAAAKFADGDKESDEEAVLPDGNPEEANLF
jgi:hypothetical protein